MSRFCPSKKNLSVLEAEIELNLPHAADCGLPRLSETVTAAKVVCETALRHKDANWTMAIVVAKASNRAARDAARAAKSNEPVPIVGVPLTVESNRDPVKMHVVAIRRENNEVTDVVDPCPHYWGWKSKGPAWFMSQNGVPRIPSPRGVEWDYFRIVCGDEVEETLREIVAI